MGVHGEFDRLVRYDTPLLVDAEVQNRLRHAGYAVWGALLDDADVARLHDIADEFLERLEVPWGEQFLTVGRTEDPALRSVISARTAEIVLPALTPLFVEDARLRGSALQIKPPSPTSELNSHQDSSLVDEREWLGVYAWIALDDTTVDNGTLHVLPGSHRFGCWQRSLNIDWQLAPFWDRMNEASVPLEVEAGTLVLFDSALVHSSPPNRTERRRLATNAFIAHRDAPMLHMFRDERTSDGMVEAYEIQDSFFSNDDIMARPGPPHRFLGEWPQHRIDWSMEEFDAVCQRAMAEAAGPGDSVR